MFPQEDNCQNKRKRGCVPPHCVCAQTLLLADPSVKIPVIWAAVSTPPSERTARGITNVCIVMEATDLPLGGNSQNSRPRCEGETTSLLSVLLTGQHLNLGLLLDWNIFICVCAFMDTIWIILLVITFMCMS